MISCKVMGDALKQQNQVEKLGWKMQNNLFFSSNEMIFIQLDELDELDRIPHA